MLVITPDRCDREFYTYPAYLLVAPSYRPESAIPRRSYRVASRFLDTRRAALLVLRYQFFEADKQ